MTYQTKVYGDVTLEEFVTGRLLRLTSEGKSFKFFAHSEGENGIAIYIGHGQLTTAFRKAIREWAKEKGIKIAKWGRSPELDKVAVQKAE